MSSFPEESLVNKNQYFVLDILTSLNKSPSHLKKRLENSNDEEIETLIEIIRNLLAGNKMFKSPEYIKRMQQYVKLLRNLVNSHSSVEYKRRKIIRNQKGGALLASLVIPVIGSLLSGIISRQL